MMIHENATMPRPARIHRKNGRGIFLRPTSGKFACAALRIIVGRKTGTYISLIFILVICSYLPSIIFLVDMLEDKLILLRNTKQIFRERMQEATPCLSSSRVCDMTERKHIRIVIIGVCINLYVLIPLTFSQGSRCRKAINGELFFIRFYAR